MQVTRHKMQLSSLLCVGMAVLIPSCLGARVNAAQQRSAESEIRSVLDMQTSAWNRGDIDTFMTGYWKSEETEFVGASGIARGWQAVLDRYRRKYPDAKAMGRLTFSNLEVHAVCPDSAFVIGEFQLERDKDRPTGIFTLNFRKFAEGWRIVADHTTGFPAPSSAGTH
jgi:ketosteroid isomerase-like protein